MNLDIDFGTPDQVEVVSKLLGAHLFIGPSSNWLNCPGAIGREIEFTSEEFLSKPQLVAYVEAHTFHQPIVKPKNKPKTYGAPKIGKRGKIAKWCK